MAKHARTFTLALGLASLSGCVLWMREPEFYTRELTELLDGRSEAIEACYDRALSEDDPNASGDVVVKFVVAADTGTLTNIEVDREHSDAAEQLAACVTAELAALRLDPPDVNAGHATFTWQFRRGSQKRPPIDPFAGAQAAVLSCYSNHLATVDRNAKGELVIDYAFDRKQGTIERLEVVPDATTVPGPVVECAMEALAASKLAPEDLDDRNAAGRRTFTLRYQAYQPLAG
jgi:hypothetical protein